MPEKIIARCKICNKIIYSYRGHKGFEWRMSKVRKHYKKYHPTKFKTWRRK